MNTQFYNVASRLDQLKVAETVSSDDIEELVKYLEEEKFSRYFFLNLENPIWVTPLQNNGIFLRIPPPIEDPNNPGYFGMPVWYSGEYLKKMADKFVDIVKDVANSLTTNNSRAIKTIFEALLRIPANHTAETIGNFRRWLETPFTNSMMLAHEIGLLINHLTRGGQVQHATTVLNLLLEPIQIKDHFDEAKLIAGSRHDYYWLNEAIQKNLPDLVKAEPVRVASIAENNLIKAISFEIDPKNGEKSQKSNSFWRLYINPSSEYQNQDIKNLLVNILITSLDEACQQQKKEVSTTLSRFIESEYSIFQRVGMYLLRSWGQSYPELLEQVYTRNIESPILAAQQEFEKLLEIQFINFSDSVKNEIINKSKQPDSEWVENILSNYADRLDNKPKDEIRTTIIEKMQLNGLYPYAEYLSQEDKDYLGKLISKYGTPEARKDDGEAIISWVSSKTPEAAEELGNKTISEVVQILIEYKPSNETPFEASREGLSRLLETDAQSRAVEYITNSNLFINDNLPFIYHSSLIRGLTNTLRNKERLPLDEGMKLLDFIVHSQKDPFQIQPFEEGLSSAKLNIARFFEELFRSRENYIENSFLDKAGELLTILLQQEDPFPDIEDSTGYDPATYSLNCVHGVAMHAVISYGIYCERKRKSENNEGTPQMVPLLKQILSEKLDKSIDPSLAVHSVLGWYFPQFIYLDREWTLDNQSKIFPIEKKLEKYWHAAWNAYLRFSDVYTNVFPAMIAQYQRALEELPKNVNKQSIDRSDEKIASHVLKAYLLGMIDLDSKDNLMPLYLNNSSDDIRAHGIFWLSQVLENQKPTEKDEVWKKVWLLWQLRIQEATNSEKKELYTKEISSFGRLLKNTPLDLAELSDVIMKSLSFEVKGFEAQEIIEYLGKYSEKYPSLAITYLQNLVTIIKDLYLLDDAKVSFEKILIAALESDNDSKNKAISLINLLGERGDYSWRRLIK